MSEHTPGPWHVHWGDKVWSGTEDDRKFIAEAWGEEPGESEANARLIAAAPSLLEAIKRLIREPSKSAALAAEALVQEVEKGPHCRCFKCTPPSGP